MNEPILCKYHFPKLVKLCDHNRRLVLVTKILERYSVFVTNNSGALLCLCNSVTNNSGVLLCILVATSHSAVSADKFIITPKPRVIHDSASCDISHC